jgi:hypothetical protein
LGWKAWQPNAHTSLAGSRALCQSSTLSGLPKCRFPIGIKTESDGDMQWGFPGEPRDAADPSTCFNPTSSVSPDLLGRQPGILG